MRLTWKTIAAMVMFTLSGFGLGVLVASPAYACDYGSYYDPSHQICQGTPPAYQPPNFYPGPSNNPSPSLPRNSRLYPY